MWARTQVNARGLLLPARVNEANERAARHFFSLSAACMRVWLGAQRTDTLESLRVREQCTRRRDSGSRSMPESPVVPLRRCCVSVSPFILFSLQLSLTLTTTLKPKMVDHQSLFLFDCNYI